MKVVPAGIVRAMLLFAPILIGSCSSIDDRIFEGEPPRLREGTITMKTRWLMGTDQGADVRRARSKDGNVTAELLSPERGHFIGSVPSEEWVKLWQFILAKDPFGSSGQKVDDVDPGGGPYHLITLELGSRRTELSAQQRTILFFTTKGINERLELSGAIVDFVAKHAKELVGPPTEETVDLENVRGR